MNSTEQLNAIKKAVDSKRPPRGFPVKLVAIDGHGGSGKSVLAEELSRVLEAEVIHTDDFASWESADWWPRLMADVLEPIKSGAEKLSYNRSKWAPDHNPKPVVDQPITPIMILEGVSSLRKEFRSYLTYGIWVDTPREICLQRGLERDGQASLPKWEKWLAEEDAYIERDDPASRADLKISGVGNT